MDLSRKDTDQILFSQGSADSTAILNHSQPGRLGGTGRRSGLSHSANERAGFLTQIFSQTLDMVMIT